MDTSGPGHTAVGGTLLTDKAVSCQHYTVSVVNDSMEQWWRDTDKGKRMCSKENCRSATLSTTNLIRMIIMAKENSSSQNKTSVNSTLSTSNAVGEMILIRENRSTRRKPCYVATLFTANCTWARPGQKPGLATERLTSPPVRKVWIPLKNNELLQ